ncbi:MAG TPA: hypothetical protein VN903_05470 [Polyangia bacterium]|jgi:hypothetical protein|nr:hypothetical protein [Polyangia bacterium]
MTRSLTVAVVASLLLLMHAQPAAAADSPVGSWVKKTEAGKPAMTLEIEQWSPGKAKLTWHIPKANMELTLVTALDGSFAPLLMGGKPSGETMSIKIVDKLHTATIVKMNSKPFGTSKATFSPDYKTMTVENDFAESLGGNTAGKTTEVWTRK